MFKPLLLRRLAPARIYNSKSSQYKTFEVVQTQRKASRHFSLTTSLRTKPTTNRDKKKDEYWKEFKIWPGKGRTKFYIIGILIIPLIPFPFTWPKDTIFYPPAFTPFVLVKKENISSTCAILTLEPKLPSAQAVKSDPYKELWEQGTWSVEIKQPELQIARSYTPLPPMEKEPTESTTQHPLNSASALNFLIRKEAKGEVSTYLHNLPVGAEVHLRGPHSEFELEPSKSNPESASRGTLQNIVFLAGGTGIAPALQLAHTIFERRGLAAAGSKMHIVWASRRREDCERGPVVRQLKALQAKYPDQLFVDCLVDEEGTYLDQMQISRAMEWDSSMEIEKEKCYQQRPESLVVISGPEGFVRYFAGSKVWRDGKETQGSIGGILGRMELKGWNVWKL